MADVVGDERAGITRSTNASHELSPLTPSPWRALAIVMLCLGLGFLGGWLAITTQKGTNGNDVASNGQKIVLKESELISQAVSKVNPSVVSITTKARTTQDNSFFGPEVFESEGAGTGIILSQDGLIITNKHVIPQGTTDVRVILADGTEYDHVRVVSRDPFNDLAFVQIEGAKDLRPAKLGDSASMEVGDKVIAIGNALGQFENTVTAGIISGIGRPIVAGEGTQAEQLQDLLQTDAAINPGNSGGPLVNLNGEVVGINTAVAGNAENIGFSIPINDAKPAITSVQKLGKVVRPYLGVRYSMLTKELAKRLELPVSDGAVVLQGTSGQAAVVSGSPAAKAGLKANDVITKVNAIKLDQKYSLVTVISQFQIGEAVQLTVVRDGKTITLSVKLEATPARLSQ